MREIIARCSCSISANHNVGQLGNDSMLQEKQYFFSKLPHITMEKFEGYIDDSLTSKYQAIKTLLNYHSGEVVEVRQDMIGKWLLISRKHENLPEQFNLHKNEAAAKKYRPPKLSRYEQVTLELQMRKVAGSSPVSESCSVLQPDFKGQRNRLMVPCVGTSEYVWVRARSVITLGELFVHLHHKYTARHIYYLYLHMEIVGIKQQRSRNKCWLMGEREPCSDVKTGRDSPSPRIDATGWHKRRMKRKAERLVALGGKSKPKRARPTAATKRPDCAMDLWT